MLAPDDPGPGAAQGTPDDGSTGNQGRSTTSGRGEPQADPDPARIVAIVDEYHAAAGRPMLRACELRTNLAIEPAPSFLDEARPLLRPGDACDPAGVLDWVQATLTRLLR